jgi:fumarate reductase flavoprotein subunit
MVSRFSGKSSESTDAIVIGAGGCGLTAALAMAEKGIQVLLLEKESWPGGNTALTAGIAAAGSRFQREEGIDDTAANLTDEILRRNNSQSDILLTETLARNSAGMVEWLAEIAGIKFHIEFPPYGHSVPRGHRCGGGWALVHHLMNAIARRKNIRPLFSTPAVSLKLEAKGMVTGVITKKRTFMAHKVILATGGFGANRALVSRHIPTAIHLPYHGHRGSTGDGLRMGIAAGGVTGNVDSTLTYPSYFAPLRAPVPQVLVYLGAILVDEHGNRFADETKFPGVPSAKMIESRRTTAYEIIDERIFQAALNPLSRLVETKVLEKGESAEELARKLGISETGLQQTLNVYNSSASRGKDEFGRTLLMPLGLPLYGVQTWLGLYCTFGGLKVNTNAQVIRRDGSVVPNLYAGGDVSEGISGSGAAGYLPGNGLLAALGLGKIAGEHAASLIIEEKQNG